VLKELARIHTENKQKDKAIDVFHRILELVPSDAEALAFLGPAAQVPVRPSAVAAAAARPVTPIPSQVRAATSARFNLTAELPVYEQASGRMTGSMPLIDEASLSGVDFALPEYDDSDFSADMEPPPDPRAMSAAGERHAEEISKILAETDVYVKYGLHQKAVDHLRRVFTLDGENVEARERLKDIFMSQGREQEAELELLRLAEVVAPSDPDRAETYLQEILAMNGAHTGAFELARRFRLRVARMASVNGEAELEVTHDYAGGISIAEPDLDALALVSPSRTGGGVTRKTRTSRDPIDEFDPDELIGRPLAHGSPAPGRPPAAPIGGYAQDPDDFELEFELPPSQATRQMSPEVTEVLASAHGAPGEHLPFDPDAARAFDAAVPKVHEVGVVTAVGRAHDFEETAVPQRLPDNASDTASYEAIPEDALDLSDGYHPDGTESVRTPQAFAEPTAVHSLAASFGASQLEDSRPESAIEDELDEAEFYVGQGMYAEAIDGLRALLARFPGHRLVLAKLREIEAIAAGGDGASGAGDGGEVDRGSIDQGTASDAINIDDLEEMGIEDIEEMGGEDLVELDSDSRPVHSLKKRQPAVMLERPVDEGDSDTHYDLGLAYKEMTLLDDAIKAFEKALRAPGREVQCRVMIGICLREMGNPSDAIHQFKQALHVEPSERERQSLYYEIGLTYEVIGDDSEALYFFEMVLKRDPSFADTAVRAERLRARGGRVKHAHDDAV
jgi:tetratricopeptide (TPR) repeat protein